MKKFLWILILLILIAGIAFFAFKDKNINSDSYVAEKTVTRNDNIMTEENEVENTKEKNIQGENKEEIISEFLTKLPNDTKERDYNIELGCKNLNGNIVKSGEIFSFWDNLGCTTKEKGYKKAKTFTSDGKVTKSYGGGVCQISTTIYNAVLKVNGLEVKERHEHSREVAYIKDGKDAAVSYGSADFKFKNTLDYDIKIETEVKDREVIVKLIRI